MKKVFKADNNLIGEKSKKRKTNFSSELAEEGLLEKCRNRYKTNKLKFIFDIQLKTYGIIIGKNE